MWERHRARIGRDAVTGFSRVGISRGGEKTLINQMPAETQTTSGGSYS
jgi:hypothetical protein